MSRIARRSAGIRCEYLGLVSSPDSTAQIRWYTASLAAGGKWSNALAYTM